MPNTLKELEKEKVMTDTKRKKALEVTFSHHDGINQTLAIPLIAAAWNELLKNGYASNETFGSWDNQVIIAHHKDKPVGIICYEHIKWRKIVWISVSYVMPKFRQSGVYRQLFGALENKVFAMPEKPVEIQGGVSVKNDSMIRAALAIGREPLFTVYTYKLREQK